MRRALFQRVTEESIDPVEGNGATSDHRAGCHCPPQRVGSGKFPDSQQTGNHSHKDTRACRPEGDSSDYMWIQKPPFRGMLSRALQIVLLAPGRHGSSDAMVNAGKMAASLRVRGPQMPPGLLICRSPLQLYREVCRYGIWCCRR